MAPTCGVPPCEGFWYDLWVEESRAESSDSQSLKVAHWNQLPVPARPGQDVPLSRTQPTAHTPSTPSLQVDRKSDGFLAPALAQGLLCPTRWTD